MAQLPSTAAPHPGHRTVGVIGHVRHGKTALVRALTGTDTDRLPEERARGMSIVLGYAHCRHGETVLDLIDVPGHEAFVPAMVAGASGFDLALLVVDAREGVMPQTREHAAIAALMGVRIAVLALSKADLVPPAERAARQHAVEAALAACGVAGAVPVWVSAASGEGLRELEAALAEVPSAPPPRLPRPFALPIDRVFLARGRGLVVTGTLHHAALAVPAEVELQPAGKRAHVRELQVHGAPVAQALPGQRVGINLRGVKAEEVARGLVLAPPGVLAPAWRIDASLSVLADAGRCDGPRDLGRDGRPDGGGGRGDAGGDGRQGAGVRDGQRVRLLFGTASVAARLRILGADRLAPGASGFVQLHCERPVAGWVGAAFVLRGGTPVATLGGGRLLDCQAPRHRLQPAVLERLRALQQGGSAQAAALVQAAGARGIELPALAQAMGMAPAALAARAELLAGVVRQGTRCHAPACVAAAAERLCEAVALFHREQPARTAAPAAWCRDRLALDAALFELARRHAEAAGRLAQADGGLRLPGRTPDEARAAALRALAESTAAGFRSAGCAPPPPETVAAGSVARRQALSWLVERGTLVPVRGGPERPCLLFHREALLDAQRRLWQRYPPPARFTLSEARQLLGSTRKYVVPVMEHFDARRITARHGDERCMLAAPPAGD